MKARVDTLWRVKSGNSTDEFEDACSRPRSHAPSVPSLRCAIADGATESSFSGQWARQLVQTFGRPGVSIESWIDAIPTMQRAWRRAVATRDLPWYAEQKVRSGAFAAFVGVHLTDSPTGPIAGQWQALSIGDSCMFIVRDGDVELAFPLQTSDAFGSTPYLLSSVASHTAAVRSALARSAGPWYHGDRFFLLTDALAQWFLRCHEAGGRPWETLDTFINSRGRRQFTVWLAEQRRSGSIRNDDTTMLRIEVE